MDWVRSCPRDCPRRQNRVKQIHYKKHSAFFAWRLWRQQIRTIPGHISLVEIGSDLRQTIGVKPTNFLVLVLVSALLAGCQQTETAVAPSIDDLLPTRAQPKLPTMKIVLCVAHDNSFQPIAALDAELALTQKEEMTGMMFRTNIQDTDSMLFVLPVPQRASFWMKNCPESISAAYISPDGVIQEIHHLEKNDTNAVVAASGDIQFVLETSDGWFARHNVNTGAIIRTEHGSLAETFLRN
jgi:uncharacterized membrane protein (UPF0127 family)